MNLRRMQIICQQYFLTECPYNSVLKCDEDRPVFPTTNNEGKGIYICRIKYAKSWEKCAEIETWGSNAISRFVTDDGEGKICF